MKIEIEIDDSIVSHLNGNDGSDCGAFDYKPCFFSESVMYDIAQAVKAGKPIANAWPNTDEQCTCGHAADRHGLDAICNEDCPCTGYESWVTPEMALTNSRRIAGDNADLAMKARSQFAIANKAVEEVRELAELWRGKEHFADSVGSGHGYMWRQAADGLEAIVQRFDAAIKQAIQS